MTDAEKLEAAKMTLLAKMSGKQGIVGPSDRPGRMTGHQQPGELRQRTSRVPSRTSTRQPHQEQRPMQQQRQSAQRRRPAPGPTPPGTVRRGRMTGYQEPGAMPQRRPGAGAVPPRVRTRQPHQERRPMQQQRQSVPRPPPRRTAPGEVIRRSMVDEAGRTLKKGGLYAFKHIPKDAAKIPAKYLFDYLCAFIEEAYEHEKDEPMHRKIEARDLPTHMARAIMGELVQCMPTNANLMRACKKYNCTQDSISQLLVSKGILKPQSDTMWTDSDSARAMGAGLLAEGDAMAYSQPAPWMQQEPAPRIGRDIMQPEVGDVSHLVIDDHVDPAMSLAMRKSVEMRMLWPESVVSADANISETCPVHGGREMHKAMNLWNPMLPCSCKEKANAYG